MSSFVNLPEGMKALVMIFNLIFALIVYIVSFVFLQSLFENVERDIDALRALGRNEGEPKKINVILYKNMISINALLFIFLTAFVYFVFRISVLLAANSQNMKEYFMNNKYIFFIVGSFILISITSIIDTFRHKGIDRKIERGNRFLKELNEHKSKYNN